MLNRAVMGILGSKIEVKSFCKKKERETNRFCTVRRIVFRTAVAFALLTFAPLSHSHCWHSHCWPVRTVGIRTVGFALVSFALLSFALLSGYRSGPGPPKFSDSSAAFFGSIFDLDPGHRPIPSNRTEIRFNLLNLSAVVWIELWTRIRVVRRQ